MLPPSIIIIYDELEADHPATWSWLLHNYDGFTIDAKKQTIFAVSETAKAQVTLFSSSDIDLNITAIEESTCGVLLRWFDEICNLHCCLWNLISESVTQREGSCNKSGVLSFSVLRLFCGVD